MKQGITIAADATAAKTQHTRQLAIVVGLLLGSMLLSMAPQCVFAGASPFTTGATATSTNILAILTPIAVIAVMAVGVAALVNKISWGWAVAATIGIATVFGAPQIIAWVRGMFGV